MALVKPADVVPLRDLGRVHLVGIGGAGMSAIARIMLARGVAVSGSDAAESVTLKELAALGARVHVGHDAANLGDAGTLVVSSAIREQNPELVAARQRGLRVLHRAGALASLADGRRVIAVTGTHGKTTTTSMIATILLGAGAEPGYAIGGTLASTGVNAADGPGRDFVIEADESDGSFLMLAPDAAVITNVDADHLDNYGTVAAYQASFTAFCERIVPGGILLACADDPGAAQVAAHGAARGLRVRTYGESAAADYRLARATVDGMTTRFRVQGPAGELDIQVGVPGRHYALNGTAALAIAAETGTDPQAAAAALAGYQGAGRRMEPKGEARGVRVLDTYAHHPTEIAADLAAAKDIAVGGRVIAVFQPHLFSRTRIFAADLGAALARADEAIVLDVYAAREDPEPGITGQVVVDAVPGGARYVPLAADVPRAVAALAKAGDVVLTMGAGDITRVGPLILAEIAAGQ
ncbi:MAG TPA: UDP-N-acetylmuramate--L-alanine ligase [Trebonia sp.]|jgi:UDP-N-acetylmuramate--alanine ligase|nr:UDP-N-acetylmuramate--L-alanine ligase [Trebonia sp.]